MSNKIPFEADLVKASEEFSARMLARLKEKEAQGFSGWRHDHLAASILQRLEDKVMDLQGELAKPFRSLSKIEKTTTDIGNFAMMLAGLYGEQDEQA